MRTIRELLDLNLSGTDILHGELKNMIYEADLHLNTCVKREEDTEYANTMDSMDRTYAEGYMDALIAVNHYVIDLTYAISDRSKSRG